MEEARGLRRWHSSCDNWVCFDTLSSGRRIFPRAAGSSDGAQRLREQPRECKRARVEVILHSRLNELARLFRQLKRNDPLPVHILISPFCSTADGFTSLPETLRYSLKRFDIGLFCTIIWVTHTVLYEVVRCIVAKAVQRTLDFHPSASFQRFNLYLYLNICDILYVISLLVLKKKKKQTLDSFFFNMHLSFTPLTTCSTPCSEDAPLWRAQPMHPFSPLWSFAPFSASLCTSKS